MDVFTQVSARSVFKAQRIRSLGFSVRGERYLMSADLDFVVCQLGTGEPLLIVEFDGVGGGLSRDGSYVPVRQVDGDSHRKLKLDAKLAAAEACDIPMVVLSFPEVTALTSREASHTVIDGIVAEVVAAPMIHEYVMTAVGHAIDAAPGLSPSDVQELILQAEAEAEVLHHPIARSITKLRQGIPLTSQGFMILSDRPGFCGMKHWIGAGLDASSTSYRERVVVEHDLYIRELNSRGAYASSLVHTLGEYALFAKAHATIGTDIDAWRRAVEQAEWRDWLDYGRTRLMPGVGGGGTTTP